MTRAPAGPERMVIYLETCSRLADNWTKARYEQYVDFRIFHAVDVTSAETDYEPELYCAG